MYCTWELKNKFPAVLVLMIFLYMQPGVLEYTHGGVTALLLTSTFENYLCVVPSDPWPVRTQRARGWSLYFEFPLVEEVHVVGPFGVRR